MRMNSANQALTLALALILLVTLLLSLAGCAPFFRGGVVPISSGCGNNCPPSPEFLYATRTDHILVFTLDPSTGALGAPLTMTGPNQSLGMVASATLGHLYVSDFSNDAVDGFSINSSSGGLTAITGSPFPLGARLRVRAVCLMSFPVTSIYMPRISMPAQWPGLLSTRPAGSLRRFPALPFPQATLPCTRHETTLASSCT